MSYDIDYKALPVAEADEKAIKDLREYISEKNWEIIIRALCNGELTRFQDINVAFGFAGVTGYPVHAFGRLYCPKMHQEWMDK
jgi:hypothetical protein